MDFVKSHCGKMQLWIVEHFHLHKKVPVVINHNIQFFQTLWYIFLTRNFMNLLKYGFWKKSLLQNPTLNSWTLFVKIKVFNYSELHFAEVTFYKIHTLIIFGTETILIIWNSWNYHRFFLSFFSFDTTEVKWRFLFSL